MGIFIGKQGQKYHTIVMQQTKYLTIISKKWREYSAYKWVLYDNIVTAWGWLFFNYTVIGPLIIRLTALCYHFPLYEHWKKLPVWEITVWVLISPHASWLWQNN